MRVKDDSVNIWGLEMCMQPVLRYAEKIWKDHGRTEGVTITSARDGIHSAGSLHYYGRAVDLRTRYFDDHQVADIVSSLEDVLGIDYDVIYHGTHIHVEYDPR